ncbi:23S rRNA (guanosine(2251)-2'-O)-methyltransferase RlmB [Clostridiaceae bacterium M8S5]|nr:23S rRNA (guanosine(2251)-2'-O)-methyltransferase RlmB [Clostridiaceae bacterium M8S5]
MKQQAFIAGRNPVLEAIKSKRAIDKIVILKGIHNSTIDDIKEHANQRGLVVQYVPKNKLDSIAQNCNHQGVIAFVAMHNYYSVDDILDYAKAKEEDPFIVVLDEIADPHNLGAIMRTAECVGAHGIIIPKRRSVGLTATVAKTASGAMEYVKVSKVTNIADTIKYLKEKGIWVYGADMDGEDYYYNTNMKGPIALVIGSEGKGMKRLVKESCDLIVKIPMKGKVTSLNASVAAGILLYEIRKQRG